MDNINNVSIGIQARSTSERFPRKIFQTIGGKPMIQHVLDSCMSAAKYCNKYSLKNRARINVNLLVPEGDEILSAIKNRTIYLTDRDIEVQVIEGPEHDVLTRYVTMAKKMGSDYIVRITADCPLIPPYLIHKTITSAIMGRHDYCANIELTGESCDLRLSIDGHDCEVMTRKVLDWIDQGARGKDREHVTTLYRRETPTWSSRGFMIDFADFSKLKLSVDTPEELEEVRRHYEKVLSAIATAEKISGKWGVHRI